MCETCGCGNADGLVTHVHYDEKGNPYEHSHEYGGKEHAHDHHQPHGDKGEHTHLPEKRIIDVNKDILAENNKIAENNRSFFTKQNVVCLNMVSSPGSGKTTILEKTIRMLSLEKQIFVIEGDQQTSRDAERIRNAGAPAVQVNTGTGCHLDARMVSKAIQNMEITKDSILFIENVGNLVCPALFDLGEQKRVVVISVTEGDDKPLKYPYMFASSHLCLVNKTDLLPYVDFSLDMFIQYSRQVNPKLQFIAISAKTGKGMDEWLEWILKDN